MQNFISPSKTASVAQEGGGLYVGTITSIQQNPFAVFVEIPQVSPGFSFGPCLIVQNNTNYTLNINFDAKTYSFTNSKKTATTVGAQVVCAFLANSLDQVVVLGTVTK